MLARMRVVLRSLRGCMRHIFISLQHRFYALSLVARIVLHAVTPCTTRFLRVKQLFHILLTIGMFRDFVSGWIFGLPMDATASPVARYDG